MTFRSADRVYVDESKARGYYVVATATVVGDVQASNRALRELLKPGQRRIHFKSESDRPPTDRGRNPPRWIFRDAVPARRAT